VPWAEKDVPSPAAGAAAVFAYVEKMSGRWGEGRYDLALLALHALFDSETVPTSDRVRAALRASELHSALKERGESVKILERALSIKDITKGERGKLSLQRVTALMTDEKYQEVYTASHLDKASAALLEALRFAGATEGERYAAVRKMTAGYLAAGECEKCIAFAEARLKDVQIDAKHQAYVYITIARAWMKMKNWQEALSAFSAAHRTFNDDRDREFRRAILVSEAEAAEQAKDYVRAVACWTSIIPVYGRIEEKDYIARAKANVARLQPLARKNNRISAGSLDDDDSKEPISLDE